MDFLWFFLNNISYSGRRSPHKDLSFQCFSPVYHVPSVSTFNGDFHTQTHPSSVDIILKYDCHILSRQLETFLCIHMIPKLPSYEFISGDGLAPLSQIMRAYSPQISHPISSIIFDCRFPSPIPASLSKILSDFFDGFISFNCCKDIQNQFNSRKSVLTEAISKSLQRLPSISKPLLAPWPIVPPKMVIMKAHPLGKFLATVSSGIYTFKFHSRDEWLSYSNVFAKHDLGSSSLKEYLKFCSLFRYIPQTNDMISMRIYVELFSLLVGMEYGSMREKTPGYPLQLIIDEINELRRVKYIYPSIKISGRFLLALMLQLSRKVTEMSCVFGTGFVMTSGGPISGPSPGCHWQILRRDLEEFFYTHVF